MLAEHLLTISILGLLAGFIFSIPIAGPISLLVTSNALKGKLKQCNLLAIGASLADFIYVLIAVYGISHLFSRYEIIIPYVLGTGAFLVLYVGIKIIRTEFDIEHIDEEEEIIDKKVKKHKGAFYTGFVINFFNPTLFFGWLVSSFVVLSFAASLGFDTGGLATEVDKNLEEIGKIEGKISKMPQIPSYLQFDTLNILKKESASLLPDKMSSNNHFLTSLFYSGFLAAGSILWFSLLTGVLVKFRKKINIGLLNWIVRGLGIVLCMFAVFFGFSAVKLLL